MTSVSSTAPLLLVDGSSYLYRAFFASQQADLRTAAGFPSGAIRVMTNMLRSLMKQYPDSHVAVVFDAKGKTFRNELYAEYKANRPPMPDDLRLQVEPIHNIIRAMGLPLLIVEGVEADDVMGTLAHQATEQKVDTIISTGDKDMAQLVSEHVTLIDTMKDSKMDREAVIEKFGVPPEQIIDYLALVGDKVDNIPGVPKCGPKTAVKWLQQFGSLQAVMDGADSVKGKIGENLRGALEQLPLSYQLATIKTDVELDLKLEELVSGEVDVDSLRALYQEYEFRTLLKDLDKQSGDDSTAEVAPPAPAREYDTVLDKALFNRWLDQLKGSDVFAFDTETTSLNYMEARIVGVSFAVKPGQAAYVPCAHDYLGAPEQLPLEWVLEQLRPLLEDENVKKVGQNLKYDRNVLLNHGIELKGIAFDTMLESYVLDSTATRHDMDSMASRYLEIKTVKYEEVAGKGVKQLTFNQVELEQAAPYAAEDADVTLQLHEHLWPQLQERSAQLEVFNKVEMPLLPVLAKMERQGALINARLLAEQSQQLGERMAELQQEAFAAAGEEFNLGSPKQLAHILYEKEELPILKKTPKGAPSTAEEVLQELALDYPLPKLILEYRSLSKLKSTYTDKLPKMINPATGRIHTSYHQAVAATGRLSSSDPNLQNIPIRNLEGRRIRQAFIAPEGYKLVAADYSQIELRIMAHLSRDDGLLDAFAHDRDIHSATAAEVFGVPLESVTADQRRSAKAINFGLIYGMSAFGLAKQLGISRKSAQEYIDLYFERYPGVKRYMDETRAQAADQGYVETLFGRRLHLPDIKARNPARRQGAERTAINAPMQGTAADIIKRAMIAVDQWLGEADIEARMIMQVHDELVLEVKEEHLEEVVAAVTECMEKAAELAVPLKVEAGVGSDWEQAH